MPVTAPREVRAHARSYPFRTLPDYLSPGLDLVFVGINPGLYSVEHGHYFARPTSRFWRAFSRSVLSAPIRAALGRAALGPEDDAGLLAFGIGFTDVVKVPSRSAGELRERQAQLERRGARLSQELADARGDAGPAKRARRSA